MYSLSMKLHPRAMATGALAISTLIYGLVWYPYRLLAEAGLNGIIATFLTDSITLILGLLFIRKHLYFYLKNKNISVDFLLVAIAFSSAWGNLGCVLAVIEGHVIKVMLLFYLSPLWTILFARILLQEKLNKVGWGIMGLAFAGAIIMLYPAKAGWPLPEGRAEWYGLTAGMAFALANVLSRKSTHSVEIRSLSMWLGVVLLTGFILIFNHDTTVNLEALRSEYYWLIIFLVGIGIALASFFIQYGLTYLPANQAMIILLCELFVSALSAYFLAHEQMGWREWIGGSLLILSSLFADKMNAYEEKTSPI